MSKIVFTNDSLKSFIDKIKDYVTSKLATKADLGHSHDNYAKATHEHEKYSLTTHKHTASEVGASASDHNHNGAYYTEIEIDTLMAQKADSSHTHSIANVTNLQSTLNAKAAQTDLDELEIVVVGKANTSHTHTVSNISDLTATATEINYMDGVTSNVQTQLDHKTANSGILTIAVNSMATFTFSNKATALISLRGTTGVLSGCFLVSGYPIGGPARVIVTPLQQTSSIVYGIVPEKTNMWGVTIWNKGTNAISASVVGLLGDLPTVTIGSDGGATESAYKDSLNRLDGTLSVSKGGTGATTASDALINLGAAKAAYKAYSSFGTASTEADGWYTLFTISDNAEGAVLCLLKGYAHSSAVFTATKGYSTTATLNILDCNTSNNGSYAYIKALRILSDGRVQAKINNGTVNININIFSANGKTSPVDSLICDNSNPTVCVERTLSGGKMMANGFVGDLTGNASTATNVAWSGVTSKPSYYDAKAIKSITRNGTTFTYTCMDGTTGTFTQQDNNTTYSAATTSAAGLMSAADKTKLDNIALTVNSDGVLMLSV